MIDERILREQARRALKAGKLPNRRPDSTWGGPGAGQPCSVCGSPVTRDEVELEIEFAGTEDDTQPRTHHIHVRCFEAWESECKGTTSDSSPSRCGGAP